MSLTAQKHEKTQPLPSVTELTAAAYLKLGWSPIPVAARAKTPLVDWKTYQQRHPCAAEVREWFTRWPKANIGIQGQLGHASPAITLTTYTHLIP